MTTNTSEPPVEKHKEDVWVFEGDQMVYKPVYVPEFYRIFDRMLRLVAGMYQRDEKMDSVKVDIDVERKMISMYIAGVHRGFESCLQDTLFRQLMSRSNHGDAGNGEIFFSQFLVEIADGDMKEVSHIFNRTVAVSEPSISRCKAGENWTKATFNMTHLEDDDVVALMKKGVVELAACLGKTVKVELNGVEIPVKSFLDYVNLYLLSAFKITVPRIKKVSKRWDYVFTLRDGEYQDMDQFQDMGSSSDEDISDEDISDKDSSDEDNVQARNFLPRGNCWFIEYEPDPKEKVIRFEDFVSMESTQFSIADLQRSIPSMVDGFNPGQRKILFSSFKCNLVDETIVAEFTGYVSEHSAYHHSETGLAEIIIGMAQDFVGSNNINLLQPSGQFGTRHEGGKDHGSASDIYTCLSPITRFLFPKDDDILLDYLTDDGLSIEPTWYVPVIPTVLVNGSEGIGISKKESEGIGTGLTTFIPNYNPRDIIANLKRLLNSEPMVPMIPWYKGFNGTIEKTSSEGVYNVTGVIQKVNKTTLWISELPVWSRTQVYKAFLETMMTQKEPFIKDYTERSDGTTARFLVTLSEDMEIPTEEEIMMKLFLTDTISTNNMHLLDPKGAIKKYDTPEQILEDFYRIRLEFYKKRMRALPNILAVELKKLDNKVKFIHGVLDKKITILEELFPQLRQKGFDTFPEDAKVEENGYEYILKMPLSSLSEHKVEELLKEKEKLEGELEWLKGATEKSLWLKDLESLEKELNELDLNNSEAEEARNSKVIKDACMSAAKQAPKNPRKCTKKASTSSTKIDNTYKATKRKRLTKSSC